MKDSFEKFKGYIRNKKVAVLGIGVSNRPLIKYIAGCGANVTACDKKDEQELGDICAELITMGVTLKLGPDYLESLEHYDMIFRTPSLRPDLPGLIKAKDNGVAITSEMEEFVKYCPCEIIGVTGSDGKTTTTTLIFKMLKEEGYNVWLGGNIGYPLFDKLDEIKINDKVVLELSSFQLMTMSNSVDRAVITNLSPNHLDIHKSMEEYIESKKNIFHHQGSNGILTLNLDNYITRDMEGEAPGKVNYFSRKQKVDEGAYLRNRDLVIKYRDSEQVICSMDEVKLPGIHNIENLLAASAAVTNLCSVESMRKVAVNFGGVEHRIEFVRELNGIKYYNDSIASSPTRSAACLKAFNQKIILIAGGYDKKIPFDELAEVGVDRVKLLVLTGHTAKKIEDAFNREMQKTGINVPILHAVDFKDAVLLSKENGVPGDIVALSPACASFDAFRNFEERGNYFKEIVMSLK